MSEKLYAVEQAPNNGHSDGDARTRILHFEEMRNAEVVPDTLSNPHPDLDELVRPEVTLDLYGLQASLKAIASSPELSKQSLLGALRALRQPFPSWEEWTPEFFHHIHVRLCEFLEDETLVMRLLDGFVPAMRKSWTVEQARKSLIVLLVCKAIMDTCVPPISIQTENETVAELDARIAELEQSIDELTTVAADQAATLSEISECKNITQVRNVLGTTKNDV